MKSRDELAKAIDKYLTENYWSGNSDERERIFAGVLAFIAVNMMGEPYTSIEPVVWYESWLDRIKNMFSRR